MKLKYLLALATPFSLVLPTAAFAFPPAGGAYVSFFAGTSAPNDATVSITEFNPVAAKSAQVQFDPGENIGGTLGYDFGTFRLEGEMSYKEGGITSVTDSSYGTRYVNTDGRVGAFAMLINGFYDLHTNSPITPYLGGGLGFANVSLGTTRGVDATQGVINNHIFSEDDDNVIAYQLGTGIEVALNRLLSVDLGYRYFATTRASMRKDWPNSTEFRLASHNATVGLRLRF
ncbi:outer membrane protein [Geomesophilobacter sediminis]|uniref:Porin family protein n=1 Tax=Geomesophilobacter sediminis TaxID=2798584 RepID=A0A8J7JLZ3_9BACT|nr:outer membrane beta-barrel protein [Geomesophilobacter sediminis]MBJ6725505.1 porin family protein [Geomesophilobacter sediminis]